MSTSRALRITCSESSWEKIRSWCDYNGTLHTMVYEIGEHEHVHILFHHDKSIQALKKDFGRTFPEFKGELHAFSDVKNDEDYLRYLCKGVTKLRTDPVSMVFTKLSDEEIETLHENYHDIFDQMQARGQEDMFDYVMRNSTPHTERGDLCDIYTSEINGRNMKFNTAAAKRCLDAVECRHGKRMRF